MLNGTRKNNLTVLTPTANRNGIIESENMM